VIVPRCCSTVSLTCDVTCSASPSTSSSLFRFRLCGLDSGGRSLPSVASFRQISACMATTSSIFAS
jgi:hypothetical protein